MNCKAKVQDEFGGKYVCENEATTKLTIVTFAPHLGRNVTHVKCLCNMHLGRVKGRYNYQIKHLGKQTTLTEEKL